MVSGNDAGHGRRSHAGPAARSRRASKPGVEVARLLEQAADDVVVQWSRDLRAGAFAKFADRPLDELEHEGRQYLEAFVAVLRQGDHLRLRLFVQRAVRLLVPQGYTAGEIARELATLELVAWPVVVEHFAGDARALAAALRCLRQCTDEALFELADVYQRAAQQQVEHYLAEMEALNRRLEELTVRDPLTGLYNRRYFQDRLTHEVQRARRHGRPLGLLIVDIDHFKQINDTYGHQAGDEVLRSIALLLVNQTRATDITARYGGEEFVAVLPETDAHGALRVAEKLRESVAVTPLYHLEQGFLGELPRPDDAAAITCTISIGVASFDAKRMADASELVRAADEALYAAKQAGRNRVMAAWMLPGKPPS